MGARVVRVVKRVNKLVVGGRARGFGGSSNGLLDNRLLLQRSQRWTITGVSKICTAAASSRWWRAHSLCHGQGQRKGAMDAR